MTEPKDPLIDALRGLAREEAEGLTSVPPSTEAELDRWTGALIDAAPARPERRRARWWIGGGVLAAAASLLLLLRAPGPVPDYRVEVSGLSEMRGSAPTEAETLLVVALPPSEVEGSIVGRAYSLTPEPRPWPAPEVASTGALRWRVARTRVAPAGASSVEVLILVGRPGALPDPGRLEARTRGADWTAIRHTLRLSPR